MQIWSRNRIVQTPKDPMDFGVQDNIELMRLEFGLENGKNVKIDFSAMSYNDNQIIKPQIIEAVTHSRRRRGSRYRTAESG